MSAHRKQPRGVGRLQFVSLRLTLTTCIIVSLASLISPFPVASPKLVFAVEDVKARVEPVKVSVEGEKMGGVVAPENVEGEPVRGEGVVYREEIQSEKALKSADQAAALANAFAIPRFNSEDIPSGSTAAELNDSNFNSTIHDNESVLSLFYAPWCYWSRKVMPEFDAAAGVLAHHDPPVKLVKVDCTANEVTMRSRQVLEFPSIRLYLNGKEHHYSGGRGRAQIVNWVNDRLNHEVKAVTHAQVENLLEPHMSEVVVIGCLENDEVKNEFIRVSREFETAIFIDVPSIELINNVIAFHQGGGMSEASEVEKLDPFPLDSKQGVLLMNPHHFHEGIRDGDEPRIVKYRGRILKQAANRSEDSPPTQFEVFVRRYLFPATSTFSKEVAHLTFNDGRPIVALCVASEVEEEKGQVGGNSVGNLVDAFRSVAVEFRGQLLFTLSGSESVFERRLMGLLAVEEDELPALRIITFNPKGNHHYHPALTYHADSSILRSVSREAAERELTSFVTRFTQGKLKPSLRSEQEPDPEDNDGPVKIVVGSTFEDIVLNNDQDVFMMFYAPWCGHCRKVEPALRMLGERIQNGPPNMSSKIIVGKLDATRNEVRNLSFTGYPTMLYFSVGRKQSPDQFTGVRSVEEMLKFIASKATVKFDVNQVLTKPTPEKSPQRNPGDGPPSDGVDDLENEKGYDSAHMLSIYEEL
eukprot:GHVN01106139.1.p1 GENE.GHVN01106139.1~~GHVN01106139.1.p1  ORF type:complete len:697 (-),score=148.00 GHVN01106139.1:176-2266(-)